MREVDTEWRQGDLLNDEHALALRLTDVRGSNHRVVIITHDCDLPNGKDQFIEVIVGSRVDAVSPEFTNAKHPRKLHITFSSERGESLIVELCHENRHQLDKTSFFNTGTRSAKFRVPDGEKRGLKQWLAARYGRPAFPTAFETRLSKTVGKRSVKRCIEKILETGSAHLIGLFFDLGEDRAAELPGGSPYALSIAIVYDATESGKNGREQAERVAVALMTLFEQAYGSADVATEIALEGCSAVADTFMTLADLRRVDQWRLEYLSLREDPSSKFLAVGELPV